VCFFFFLFFWIGSPGRVIERCAYDLRVFPQAESMVQEVVDFGRVIKGAVRFVSSSFIKITVVFIYEPVYMYVTADENKEQDRISKLNELP
jgi:hypothetical protein